MDYKEQYLDPRWQRKRLEILNRDNFTCRGCKSTSKTLNVHHLYYIKDRDVWDYLDSCYETVCNDCHKDIHLNTENDLSGNRAMVILDLISEYTSPTIQGKYTKLFLEIIRSCHTLVSFGDEKIVILKEDYGFSAYDLLEEALCNGIKFRDFQFFVNHKIKERLADVE